MNNIRCRDCVHCKEGWCEQVSGSPDPDIVRDCEHFMQMTNYDLIRGLSCHQLAVFFAAAVTRKPILSKSLQTAEIELLNDVKYMEHWLKQPCGGRD